MCGIAGILNFDVHGNIDESKLRRMSDVIAYRGPDDSGFYISENIGLAHRRLSIIDLSINGRQPFFDDTQRYCIIFNGEIYNFEELRVNLINKGYKFKSRTDTEVLLYLYIDLGPKMLDLLNGMFAFAIWDKNLKELFIARDRLGVKPLYYAIQDNSFFFASEQKSLFAGGVQASVDESAFEELLLYRSIAGDIGIFKNIFKLLPGHYLSITKGKMVTKRWWSLAEKAREIKEIGLPKDLFDWFEETFNSSINYRIISDVPVGVLLSGGLDSSSIAATLFKSGNTNINTFTVAFKDARYDESYLAEIVAKKYSMKYHQIYLEDEDLAQSLEEASWVHDEPLMHQNDAQLLAISKFAKPLVSVLMSGEGADELMSGYVRYKALKYLKFRPVISTITNGLKQINGNSRLKKLGNYFSNDSLNDLVLLNSCNLYPNDLFKYGIYVSPYCSQYRNIMLNEAISLYNNDSLRQSMYLDQHTYLCSLLDRNDRTTMAASIECREPYLDYRLVEMLAAMPTEALDKGKKGKYILLNSVGKYLPKEIKSYRKWGFGVPWEFYLRNSPYFRNVLEEMKSSEILKYPIFDKFRATKIIDKFINGSNEDNTIIRQLMMIHIWNKVYFKKLKLN